MSGSGFYDKKNLIGLVSHIDKKNSYLIPGFYINKLLDEEFSNYSPCIPIKLTMKDGEIVLFENFNRIDRGFVIKYFDGLKVNNGNIFSYELRDNIPIDIYLQIYGKVGKTIKISDGKLDYELEVENLNNHLSFPFISGVSIEDKSSVKITYQDLWERRNESAILKLINNNMLLKDRV
jgi:hypothetical protein